MSVIKNIRPNYCDWLEELHSLAKDSDITLAEYKYQYLGLYDQFHSPSEALDIIKQGNEIKGFRCGF